ncbi:hypothetical protein QWY14_03125 [Planococcus sp. N028]|uniref:Uncharacterized protein n=1 Tax=Planococcus shixiaomingii TaxID=3058393 RepID=A0ABT8MYQ0_9BACL|nr:hypothetical protein [Planococcus sp. N028]MDN7240762.1 hypothetical protein [Planococcus sp. N028]
MTIITKEVLEMDKITVNYLEIYKNHINGYKQYKKNRVKLSGDYKQMELSEAAER